MINLICFHCNKQFERLEKNHFTSAKNSKNFYCSKKCKGLHNRNRKVLNCKNCNTSFWKKPSQQKGMNDFCSHSCSATYNNTHKTKGTRVSKLEKWLAEKLIEIYPNIEFHFNRKDAINSELDIYIPSLKIAFELNGIFHYEPIFGIEKFDQIQNNDSRKYQACIEKGISLCVIDTSQLKYFKIEKAEKYLKIIQGILGDDPIRTDGPRRAVTFQE